MFGTEIDLIEIGGTPGLREGLETMDAHVNRWAIEDSEQWLDVMTRSQRAPYLVISATGTVGGLELPRGELSSPTNPTAWEKVGPTEIRSRQQSAARSTVICLAAGSGTVAMASAWSSIGADNYIAPIGTPDAADTLIFALHLFWEICCHHRDLAQALSLSRQLGGDAAQFQLHY